VLSSNPSPTEADLSFTETSAPVAIDVSARERRALGRASGGLTITDAPDGRVWVGPREGYVGSLALPGGRRVVVRPKAEVGSLPALLALAYRTMTLPSRAGDATFDRAPPSDWLFLQFATELERVVAIGLRRSYVEQREILPFVRGRLRPVLNPALLPGADCEYTDFTLDTRENRLLRGTAEIALRVAQHPEVRKRLRDALSYFAAVAHAHPQLRDFERMSLPPLAQYYDPALRLARLVLEGSGATDVKAPTRNSAFFVLMWRVWENALYNAALDAYGGRVLFQPGYADIITHQSGTPSTAVTLKPDIVIGSRQRPRLVVDAKWSRAVTKRHGKWRYDTSHLAQIVTYCEGLDCDGALIYPLMDQPVNATYEFRHGRSIRIVTVDLHTDLQSLTATVADLVP
jgi:5-methylcytosine-specific restriction enzyme subunit McrC